MNMTESMFVSAYTPFFLMYRSRVLIMVHYVDIGVGEWTLIGHTSVFIDENLIWQNFEKRWIVN